MPTIRNRIAEHVTVRAGDLVPHPLNYRRHPPAQRAALAASYEEVGFARSLLGYRLADGRIQLIDGHLRRDFDPEMLVTVEVLDVSEEEARQLLLTLDPLAALADHDAEVLAQLTRLTASDQAALQGLWRSLTEAEERSAAALPPERPPVEQYLVLVECRDEDHQREVLERLQREGLSCRALLS
ncbi:MAG: hypothetical protein NZ700_11445 [Gemmataceae bacterium]|nr:hypothetical protein [Gemmataceae bacterium]MDW8265152.1 hypothetical protein [Gemmataceae bacterium]